MTREYKFAAAIDPLVNPDVATELWASFYRPATLAAGKKYPLVVLLHGNHLTCGTGSNPRRDDDSQYSTTGTCKTNYVVVPNHRGYDYIATDLAARGYFVVSINTNRGINGVSGPATDSNLIERGGRTGAAALATARSLGRGQPDARVTRGRPRRIASTSRRSACSATRAAARACASRTTSTSGAGARGLA